MTFSIAARCARTGMLGVAVASSSPAVAARCAFTRAGVGAVLTQNVTDPRLGPAVLAMLRGGEPRGDGVDPAAVIAALPAAGRFLAYRQVLIIDRRGRTGVHTGAKALGTVGEARGRDAVAAGNLLAAEGVPAAMVAAFEAAEGHLGVRLLAAIHAGEAAGGEAGPIRSAGLQIAHEQPWPYADLRCDWGDDPIGALAEAWRVYAPQADDYVARALDPSAAPSYGVPGDQ